VTISLLGDSVVYSKPSGYATRFDLENALKLHSNVITESIPKNRRYIQIEDYTNLSGVTINGRKYYIDYIKNRKRLSELIFCGTSPMFKMSIKLGKRLNIVNFNIKIVKDYQEAVSHALQTLAALSPPPHDATVSVTHPYIDPQKEEICRVTGLTITTRPEWTNIDLGEGYYVTFKFIGDKILLSNPKGTAGNHGMENFFRERGKVLDTMFKQDNPYFELKDYSKIHKRITKAGRNQFSVGMRRDQDKIIGFIGYNAPLSVKLAMNVGKKLHNFPFPMSIVKDYETAIKKAVKVMGISNFRLGSCITF